MEIDVPIERSEGDNYAQALAEYEKQKVYKEKNNVFLCYLTSKKKYFVSKFFKREFIINNYKTIKIIE